VEERPPSPSVLDPSDPPAPVASPVEERPVARKVLNAKLTHAGAYEIVEKIGDGGMASVYKGCKPDTGEIVAIKVLTPQAAGNPVVVERFKQEYRTACSLRHPHIVRALDFGMDGDTPYLVMELIEGEDLATRVERRGKLPEEEAVTLLIQVAEALQLAHQHRLIHRDVKPSNILITNEGEAKLTDLGLVKDFESTLELTRPMSGMGTPNYMAPEQFGDARNATARCDVYSLGATLYTAVTGLVPFNARTPLQILKKKIANDFAAPRALVPGLSLQLDMAVRRAMRADANQRQESCEEFITTLLQDPFSPVAATRPRKAAAKQDSSPRVSLPPKVERRAMVRYNSKAEASCWPVVEPSKSAWKARVQDISSSGLSLRLNRRYEPGALLAVELQPQGRQDSSFFLIRVERVKQQSAKVWTIGCSFERLLLDFEVHSWL
jgi:serine/threonine protein kinase